ncbi:MAG: 4Fe-4S binding protein [Desulfobacteraceae bacterium]|jgi:ferredoxin|nr:4Fe-4S binding protein [Desulfobacteraceae bacterium]
MTEQQVYVRLREFMDNLPTGYPETPTGVEMRILRKLFSPEEADLFMKLKMAPEDVESISRRIGDDPTELTGRLEQMAQKGLLYRTYRGETVCYQAFHFIIGIYEFQLKSMDTELAQMMEEYVPHYGMAQILSGVKTKQLRVAPVKSSLDPSSVVAPYERIREEVRKQEVISLQTCICKKEQGLLGNPCSRPHEVCFAFGDFGRYYIDNKLGRRIDANEAMEVLDKAEAAGLVLCPSNSLELACLCCCCPCCCPYLRYGKMAQRPREMFRTEYLAVIDAAACTGCENCLDRCQMAAIEEGDGVMIVLDDRCIGCGLCVAHCPEEAISLKHVPADETPPRTIDHVFDRIRQERGLTDQV